MAAFADAQSGVISTEQLLQHCGLSSAGVSRRVARGRLRHWAPRVYAVGHSALTYRGRAIGALLFGGDGARLSHLDAAELLQLLPVFERARMHVTLPTQRRCTARIHVHVSEIGPQERTSRRRLPITDAARTVLDLADTSSERVVEQALNQGHIRRLLTVESMAHTLEAANGRHGIATLRRAHEAYSEGLTVTYSMLEEAFLAFLRERGYPQPVVNQRLLGFRADFQWPEYGLVVETDGLRVHTIPWRFDRDRRRDRVHRAAGLRVERITWGDVVRRPDELDAEMRAWFLARARRRAAHARDPRTPADRTRPRPAHARDPRTPGTGG